MTSEGTNRRDLEFLAWRASLIDKELEEYAKGESLLFTTSIHDTEGLEELYAKATIRGLAVAAYEAATRLNDDDHIALARLTLIANDPETALRRFSSS